MSPEEEEEKKSRNDSRSFHGAPSDKQRDHLGVPVTLRNRGVSLLSNQVVAYRGCGLSFHVHLLHGYIVDNVG